MRLFNVILMLFVFSLDANAKDFIRDYTYRASDDDSKNIARSNAVEQAKLLLLEEIGVYIQSYVETEITSKNKTTSSFLSHEISTTTAGITKTQILTEDWNGKEYRLSAKISIDVEDVIKKINNTIKIRASSKNVAEYNRLIKQKNSEITNLNVSLEKKVQESKNQQLRLNELNFDMNQLKIKLRKQLKQEKQIKTEIGKIKHRISKVSSGAETFIMGMTQRDLEKIAGAPYSIDKIGNLKFLNYGKYWAYMPSGIFKKLIPVEEYSGPNYGYH